MASRKTTEPPAPWERPSRDPVPDHRYEDGWTYNCCAYCRRPFAANCHQ